MCTPEECAGIFPYTAWAGALKDWEGPEEGERPSAYIVIACDLSIGKNKQWDDGITAQTIMLAAAEKGYGGCMIGSCMRSEIGRLLGLDPEHYSIDLVLALGKPKEEVVLVPVKEDGSTAYYRDGNQVHYVPNEPGGHPSVMGLTMFGCHHLYNIFRHESNKAHRVVMYFHVPDTLFSCF